MCIKSFLLHWLIVIITKLLMYICILYVGSANLPFWLYIVVAVLGTVLVTVTILFACFFIIRGCKKSRRSSKNIYKVNSQKGWLPQQYEWGRRIILLLYMYIPPIILSHTVYSSFWRAWEQRLYLFFNKFSSLDPLNCNF